MSKQQIKFVLSAFLVVVVISIGLMFVRGSEDTWLCQNGQWVAHGNPANPPVGECK